MSLTAVVTGYFTDWMVEYVRIVQLSIHTQNKQAAACHESDR